MKTVATGEAKTHLSALLQQVSTGESIIINRGRRPLAKLVPYEEVSMSRPKVGEVIDTPMDIPEAALRPLSPAELAAWGL